MKRLILTITLLCLVFLTSCIERGDWKYDDLPGDYSIWRANSINIALCQSDDDPRYAKTIISAYVSEIAYNDDYIFAKQVTIPKDSKKKIDKSNPVYYILDVESEELFGSYTEDEFLEKCEEFDIKDELDWIITTELKNK